MESPICSTWIRNGGFILARIICDQLLLDVGLDSAIEIYQVGKFGTFPLGNNSFTALAKYIRYFHIEIELGRINAPHPNSQSNGSHRINDLENFIHVDNT